MSGRAARYALIFGGLGGGLAIAGIIASLNLQATSHLDSVWFGYLIMLIALTLIFAGVKRYRDVECGGVIGFGRGFGVGLGIALVAAITYSAGWELHEAFSGYDYIADYSAGILAKMQSDDASEALIAAKAAELRELAMRYRDPLFRIPMTMVEILPVGLFVAIVSAALLRNPRLLPARRAD